MQKYSKIKEIITKFYIANCFDIKNIDILTIDSNECKLFIEFRHSTTGFKHLVRYSTFISMAQTSNIASDVAATIWNNASNEWDSKTTNSILKDLTAN